VTADAAAIRRSAEARLATGPDEGTLATLAAAVANFPADAALARCHADALHLAGRLPEAEAEYARSLALDAAEAKAWYGLGMARMARGAHAGAAEALDRFLRLHPADARARTSLAEAQFRAGAVDAAVTDYEKAARDGDAEVRLLALRNLACIVPGAPSADNARVLGIRRGWVAGLPAGACPRARPAAGRKLRVGYVSSFFGGANWMKPVFGVINSHDRDRFELHLIADGKIPTAEGGYREHDDDRIWTIGGTGNAPIAARIAEHGIDVLVDLNGYSRPERLGLFTLRAAPVQIGWFNMFATTGTDAFDALVGDAAVLPPEEEAHYAERILRVPGSYLAFTVAHPAPPVAPPPCLAKGRITFGSLCSAYKLTDQVVAAWARILRGAPGARLLLRNASLDEASNAAALAARFAQEGVAAERLTLEGGAPHYEFLETYGRIDIALDAFPYNGGTTTTEALWQGVPVLAFNGDRWAARTSRSLLLAAGLGDWVADDAAAYVERAVALARDPATPGRLAALREGMRARLAASAVCDVEGLCRALEAIYVSENATASA